MTGKRNFTKMAYMVYQLTCKNCKKKYVGQTGHLFIKGFGNILTISNTATVTLNSRSIYLITDIALELWRFSMSLKQEN